MPASSQNTVVKNKKAFRDYEISERYEAGIVLRGTEIKSLREGKISFKDSYARVVSGEIWVYNLHISPYHHGSAWNHDPVRPRKLLMHKYEIKRLRGKVEERGFTLIPLQMYFVNGKAKIEIGLARGKKLHDKRKDIAKKDAQRDAERELKNRYRINL